MEAGVDASKGDGEGESTNEDGAKEIASDAVLVEDDCSKEDFENVVPSDDASPASLTNENPVPETKEVVCADDGAPSSEKEVDEKENSGAMEAASSFPTETKDAEQKKDDVDKSFDEIFEEVDELLR